MGPTGSQTEHDWRTSPDVEKRAKELVSSMTLDEKIQLVTGDLDFNYGFYNGPISRFGIPPLTMADGPPGVRIGNGSVHEGKSTALPAPIGLAASWNIDLARRYGEVIGWEVRASGHNVYLGPAIDIARVPVGGRAFESFGEDPLLNARMATNEIKAVQAHQLIACLKHYAVNNQEYERSSVDAIVDEQTIREIYLRPFEIVTRESGVASYMGAFNRVNGTYSCENHHLLNEILRQEWGFRGWVMSDYGATHSTVPSALAGLDQEQPSGCFYADSLKLAVEREDVPLETLDEMCRRILRTMVGLGVFDKPLSISEMNRDQHREVALAVAEEAVVLLKNDENLLPIDAKRIRRAVVIGCDADNLGARGGGSGCIAPFFGVSLLEGLRQRLGENVIVDYAQGNDPVSAADLLPGEDSVPSCCFHLEGEDVPGLRAEIWTNTDFWGEPSVVRVVPQVALNLGFFNFPGFSAASPKYPEFPFDVSGRISTRFTGRLTVPKSGSYHLSVTILGAVKIWLDDTLVLDFTYHGPGRAGGTGGASGAAWGQFDDDVKVPKALEAAARALGQAGDQFSLEASEFPSAAQTTPPSSGGGSSGEAPDMTSVSLALTDHPGGHKLRIDYQANSPSQGHLCGAQIRLGWKTPDDFQAQLVREAVQLAQDADVVVVAVRCYDSEQMDRPSMHLPNNQGALIRAVSEANPNTIVVTQCGGPIEIRSWETSVRAIMHAWYLGQEQGTALARLIFGDVTPSGKLPLTFPCSDAEGSIISGLQYPGIDGKVHYIEKLGVGYRGFDALEITPRFPFGFGLSYTAFAYSALEIVAEATGFRVSFSVTNTGGRPGAEVAQLYLGLPAPGHPPKHLADWRKIFLDSGSSERIVFVIDATSIERPLSVWHEPAGWEVVTGVIGIFIGASSRDIRLESEITL